MRRHPQVGHPGELAYVGRPRIYKLMDGTVMRVFRQPIYDRKQFATTAAQEVIFFQNLGTAGALDSNLSIGGQLDSRHWFELLGISIVVEQSLPQADLNEFYNWSDTKLIVGGTEIHKVPTIAIPSMSGLQGATSTSASFFASNGVPSWQNIMPLDYFDQSYLIEPQQTIECRIQTRGTTAFTAQFYAWCFLIGFLHKPVA